MLLLAVQSLLCEIYRNKNTVPVKRCERESNPCSFRLLLTHRITEASHSAILR